MWLSKVTERQVYRVWRLIHEDQSRASRLIARLEPLLEQPQNKGYCIDIWVAKARLAYLTGAYTEARALVAQAGACVGKGCSPLQEARYLSFLGIVQILDGEMRIAKATFERAEALACAHMSTISIHLLTLIHYNLGELLKETYFDFEKSRYYFALALKEARLSNHALAPRIWISKASCLAYLGDLEAALLLSERAVRRVRQNRRFSNKATFFYIAAQMMCNLGKYALAQDYVVEAEYWAPLEGDVFTQIGIKILQGRMAYAEMSYSVALDFALAAKALMDESGILTQTDELNTLFTDVKLAMGNYGEAIYHRSVANEFINANIIRA